MVTGPVFSVVDAQMCKAEHSEKALLPIDVTEAGMAIDANLLHDVKAPAPIVVSDDVPSKVTVVKALQLSKALPPIDVTKAGMAIVVKAVA